MKTIKTDEQKVWKMENEKNLRDKKINLKNKPGKILGQQILYRLLVLYAVSCSSLILELLEHYC